MSLSWTPDLRSLRRNVLLHPDLKLLIAPLPCACLPLQLHCAQLPPCCYTDSSTAGEQLDWHLSRPDKKQGHSQIPAGCRGEEEKEGKAAYRYLNKQARRRLQNTEVHLHAA